MSADLVRVADLERENPALYGWLQQTVFGLFELVFEELGLTGRESWQISQEEHERIKEHFAFRWKETVLAVCPHAELEDLHHVFSLADDILKSICCPSDN